MTAAQTESVSSRHKVQRSVILTPDVNLFLVNLHHPRFFVSNAPHLQLVPKEVSSTQTATLLSLLAITRSSKLTNGAQGDASVPGQFPTLPVVPLIKATLLSTSCL